MGRGPAKRLSVDPTKVIAMSNEPAADPSELPDAVAEWLRAVADERGVSETELLRTLLTAGPDGSRPDARHLEEVEREFRELVEDVRDRVIQVKRETDEKAPADHGHPALANELQRVADGLERVEAELERVDHRVDRGFENYEEVLEYLTETTDDVQRAVSRLTSVVVDLRGRLRETTRDEARRTALAHLTDAANRHGVNSARCEDCDERVDVSLLVEPRCPHCDTAFTTLEPRPGFFRTSVLHTGRLPALEEPPAGGLDDELEELVERPTDEEDPVPSSPTVPSDDDAVAEAEAADGGAAVETDAVAAELQDIDGIGPAYAERLREAGVGDVTALAAADPESLAAAVDRSEATVAEWIDQAKDLVGT